MDKKIKLDNRYRSNIWLEEISDLKYKLCAEYKEDLEYMRVIYDKVDDKVKYTAIDPAGGPYIGIGRDDLIEGEIVSSIAWDENEKGFVLTFDKKKD